MRAQFCGGVEFHDCARVIFEWVHDTSCGWWTAVTSLYKGYNARSVSVPGNTGQEKLLVLMHKGFSWALGEKLVIETQQKSAPAATCACYRFPPSLTLVVNKCPRPSCTVSVCWPVCLVRLRRRCPSSWASVLPSTSFIFSPYLAPPFPFGGMEVACLNSPAGGQRRPCGPLRSTGEPCPARALSKGVLSEPTALQVAYIKLYKFTVFSSSSRLW